LRTGAGRAPGQAGQPRWGSALVAGIGHQRLRCWAIAARCGEFSGRKIVREMPTRRTRSLAIAAGTTARATSRSTRRRPSTAASAAAADASAAMPQHHGARPRLRRPCWAPGKPPVETPDRAIIASRQFYDPRHGGHGLARPCAASAPAHAQRLQLRAAGTPANADRLARRLHPVVVDHCDQQLRIRVAFMSVLHRRS